MSKIEDKNLKSFTERPFNVRDNPYENIKRIFVATWNHEITPDDGRKMLEAIIDHVTDERPFDWGQD